MLYPFNISHLVIAKIGKIVDEILVFVHQDTLTFFESPQIIKTIDVSGFFQLFGFLNKKWTLGNKNL